MLVLLVEAVDVPVVLVVRVLERWQHLIRAPKVVQLYDDVMMYDQRPLIDLLDFSSYLSRGYTSSTADAGIGKISHQRDIYT